MRKDDLPLVALDTPIQELIQVVSNGRLGLAVVMDKGMIMGIVTDGDIRREMEHSEATFFKLVAKDLMSKSPKSIEGSQKLLVAYERMTQEKVNSLLVLHDKNLVGIVQIYDLGI